MKAGKVIVNSKISCVRGNRSEGAFKLNGRVLSQSPRLNSVENSINQGFVVSFQGGCASSTSFCRRTNRRGALAIVVISPFRSELTT